MDYSTMVIGYALNYLPGRFHFLSKVWLWSLTISELPTMIWKILKLNDLWKDKFYSTYAAGGSGSVFTTSQPATTTSDPE